MRLSATEAYRLWAPVYDDHPNPLLALESRLLSECMTDLVAGTVLDVGCGTGRSMARWCKGQTDVFGADLSLGMLTQAGRKDGLHGLVTLAEASALPFATAVADLTICSFAISYFSDVSAACLEMSRVTKRSGSVVISDLHAQAIASGWSRSFRVGDERYEIQNFCLSTEERDNLLASAGLWKRKEMNAGFSEEERPLFLHAGKEHLFEGAARIPAVSLAIYTKQ